MSTMGERMASAREAKGWNASEFARAVKVTPTAVFNWEKNNVCPRPPMLKYIAARLGVSEEYLLNGQDAQTDTNGYNPAPSDLIEDLMSHVAERIGRRPTGITLQF